MNKLKKFFEDHPVFRRLIVLSCIVFSISYIAINAYQWIAIDGTAVPNWLIMLGAVVVLLTIGLPFAIGPSLSLDLIKRFEISAIIGGGIFTIITAIFLIGEYEDQRQARIIRTWQFLIQTQEQARSLVCEIRRITLGENVDCSFPPPIPSFAGTQELVCRAARGAGLLQDADRCHGQTLITLLLDDKMDILCKTFTDRNLIPKKRDCNGFMLVNGVGALTLPKHTSIRKAMISQSGLVTAVQTLFDARQPTQGLQLPWSNLDYVRAKPGQDLRFVDLSGSSLNGAHFVGAIMGGQVTVRSGTGSATKVTKETLTGGTNLAGAMLHEANLSGAALGGGNLSDAVLVDANFSSANLRRTILSHSWLFNTNLSDADLSHADLYRADFRKTILFGSILRCADLTGAKLNGVVGLTQSQLDTAIAHPNSPPFINQSFDTTTKQLLVWNYNTGEECKGATYLVRDW